MLRQLCYSCSCNMANPDMTPTAETEDGELSEKIEAIKAYYRESKDSTVEMSSEAYQWLQDDIAKIERVGDGNAGERIELGAHHEDAFLVASNVELGFAADHDSRRSLKNSSISKSQDRKNLEKTFSVRRPSSGSAVGSAVGSAAGSAACGSCC